MINASDFSVRQSYITHHKTIKGKKGQADREKNKDLGILDV